MEIEPEPIRVRSDELTWRSVEDEVIVLDRRNWGYITINDSGAVLWARLVEGATEPELVAALESAFDIDGESARADVRSFVGALREHDLVAAG